MAFTRWTFSDFDGILPTWHFAMNPTRMDTPEMLEAFTIAPRSLANRHHDIPQAVKGQSMTWDGVWRTLAEQSAFNNFLENARPVYVTDHYGRVMLVMLNSADTTRAGTHNFPERHKFTVQATLLATVQP